MANASNNEGQRDYQDNQDEEIQRHQEGFEEHAEVPEESTAATEEQDTITPRTLIHQLYRNVHILILARGSRV